MKIPSECRWVPHVRSVGSECPDEYWTPLYLKSWVKSLIIFDFIRNLKSLNIPDKNKHLIYAAQSNNIYYFKQRANFDRYRHFKYVRKS